MFKRSSMQCVIPKYCFQEFISLIDKVIISSSQTDLQDMCAGRLIQYLWHMAVVSFLKQTIYCLYKC